MKNQQDRRVHLRSVATVLACLSLIVAALFLYRFQIQKEQQLQMEYIARSLESETYETLLIQFDKARVLEGYLIETGGSFDSFDPVGEALLEGSPGIQNVLFAPQGVVAKAYPAEGNEKTIGLDLNSNGQGNLEAQAAIAAKDLFIAGPFELVEGGLGICGRLPIYLESQNGEPEYWGLISVSLKYPEIFEDNPIHRVNEQGFACRIWRINPDDNQEQTILETQKKIAEHTQLYQYEISMFNATWTIDLGPLKPWYASVMLWILFGLGVGMCVLAGCGMELLLQIRMMKAQKAEQHIRSLKQELEWEKTNTLVSQISSHFFYHTLNALQALIVLKPDAAYKMAGDFSHYLRFNVDAVPMEGGVVPFRQELRSVRAYADINQEQLGDRLRVIFQIPDVDFLMPVLTLQPIVENAIIHGIKPKVGGGTVTVGVTEDENHWYITVEDDGLGFNPEEAKQTRSIGLANVRKRIDGFRGCSMSISSVPGEGTKVVLAYSKNLEKK